jgi:hypothetical protein
MEGDVTSKYFTRSKFMNDFNPIFVNDPNTEVEFKKLKGMPERKKFVDNLSGHFSEEKF